MTTDTVDVDVYRSTAEVTVDAPDVPGTMEILTPTALELAGRAAPQFGARRLGLLERPGGAAAADRRRREPWTFWPTPRPSAPTSPGRWRRLHPG